MKPKHQGRSKQTVQAGKDYVDVVKSARMYELEMKKNFFCSDDPKWQNEIATDLMDWADVDGSLDLDTFPLSRRLSPRRFYQIKDKNPYFAQALEYAKAKIGERISAKLQNRPDYQMKMLPLYSTLWIEAEERKTAQESKFVHEYKVVDIEMPSFKSDCPKGDHE